MDDLLPRVVAQFERFEAEQYLDPVGLPTIGFGHLIQPGEFFAEPLTRKAALLLLDADLKKARKDVDSAFRGVYLLEHEWDALTSFTFNVGGGNLRTSTLRRKLVAGDKVGAGREFCRWIYGTKRTNDGVEKVRLAGLVKRRDVESCWFLGADPSTVERLAGIPASD